MTRLQLDYRRLQEEQRANREKEAENFRSNTAREQETHRYNVESLAETVRNNMRKNFADDEKARARNRQAAVQERRVGAQNAKDIAQTVESGTRSVGNLQDIWNTARGRDLIPALLNFLK